MKLLLENWKQYLNEDKSLNIFNPEFIKDISYIEGADMSENSIKYKEELLGGFSEEEYLDIVSQEDIGKTASGVIFYGRGGYSRYSILYDGTLRMDKGSTTNQDIIKRAKEFGISFF